MKKTFKFGFVALSLAVVAAPAFAEEEKEQVIMRQLPR